MKTSSKIIALTAVAVCVLSFAASHNAAAQPRRPHLLRGAHHKVCDVSSRSSLHCFAQVIAGRRGAVTNTAPIGYGPAQLHGAYQLPNSSANPATVAIVDAYDDPNITSDLAVYDSVFGLPAFPNCSKTVTTACFQKVNQNGGTSYPTRNSGWALETSLDVETVHQTCPDCKLILVEATSASYGNLMKAVDRARLMGAKVISNSYGSSEFSSELSYDTHFNYPGIAFVFSSGDGSYGATYPAASRYVTSAGGTTLSVDSNNNWLSETVWGGAGSGCSAYEAKPSFQHDSGCSRRTVADVSADADPNTGAAVYDSYAYQRQKGWFQVGGTSLAAPLIAGTYALANDTGSSVYANSQPYAGLDYSLNMHDVTSGSNGSCGGSYLCTAGTGYDGPTGLGSPKGLGAY